MKTKTDYLHFFIQVMAWILLPLVILKGFSEYIEPAWIERSYLLVFLSACLIFYVWQTNKLDSRLTDKLTGYLSWLGIILIIGLILLMIAHDWTGFINASVLIAASQIAIALMERPTTDQTKKRQIRSLKRKGYFCTPPLSPLF
jgi:asparagine N-glycosylation enzyme membrane subunit Stt3